MKSILRASSWRGTNTQKNTLLEETGLSSSWLIDSNRLVLGQKLGGGAFGTVHMCQLPKRESEQVVAKRVQWSKLSPEDRRMLVHEIKLSMQLDHPNTIKARHSPPPLPPRAVLLSLATSLVSPLLTSSHRRLDRYPSPIALLLSLSIDANECFLLGEYCDEGSLDAKHELARRKGLPLPEEPLALDQIRQIASGMAHVHGMGYMHRDLKPANIMIHGGVLKVGDFGLACPKPARPTCLTAETGSYRWMAPEVMRHEKYNELCDVYSFALLALEVLTYELPFKDMMPVDAGLAVAKQAARPPIPSSCSPALSGLIQRCWAQRFEARPSFEEVLLSILDQLSSLSAPCTPDTVHASRPVSPSSRCSPQPPVGGKTWREEERKPHAEKGKIHAEEKLQEKKRKEEAPSSQSPETAAAKAKEEGAMKGVGRSTELDKSLDGEVVMPIQLALFRPRSSSDSLSPISGEQPLYFPSSGDVSKSASPVFGMQREHSRKRLLDDEEDVEYGEAKIMTSPKTLMSRNPSISTSLNTLKVQI
ncbi:MAG: hypothetical protein SGPRY_012343 [Prymnesium sp.]